MLRIYVFHCMFYTHFNVIRINSSPAIEVAGQQQQNSKANQTKAVARAGETDGKDEEKRFTLFISIRTHTYRRIDMKKGKRNPFFSFSACGCVACAHAHALFKCYC